MRFIKFMGIALFTVGLAGTAPAATIGSLDETRVLTRTSLDAGNKRDELRAAIVGAGHTVAASQSALTAAFLAGLDVFYTSTLTFGAAGALSAAEQAALEDWVNAGGIVFSTGEQAAATTQPNYNTVLNPFGIAVASVAAQGQGVFANDPANALLAGGVAGSVLGDSGTGLVSANPSTTLALSRDVNGNEVVIGLSRRYGSGLVVAIGDSNFLEDGFINAAGKQFTVNLLDTNLQPVPLPAGLPMLLVGLGALGFASRRTLRRT